MTTTAVNYENMTVWIEALESGIYPQARKRLRSIDGFCCLGVLCDLQGAEWRQVGKDFDFLYTEVDADGDEKVSMYLDYLPGHTQYQWLGDDFKEMESLEVPTSLLTGEQSARLGGTDPDGTVNVVTLNDNWFSFAEIAAVLRAAFGIAR